MGMLVSSCTAPCVCGGSAQYQSLIYSSLTGPNLHKTAVAGVTGGKTGYDPAVTTIPRIRIPSPSGNIGTNGVLTGTASRQLLSGSTQLATSADLSFTVALNGTVIYSASGPASQLTLPGNPELWSIVLPSFASASTEIGTRFTFDSNSISFLIFTDSVQSDAIMSNVVFPAVPAGDSVHATSVGISTIATTQFRVRVS